MSESRFELNKNHVTEPSDQKENTVLSASSAGISHQAAGIFDRIVSHTTTEMDHVQSILKEGVKLSSHPKNLYGGNSFYVAENGFSIHEVNGQHTLAFRLSKKAKIYDASWDSKSGRAFANKLKSMGFDAIKYEGSYFENRVEFIKSLNDGGFKANAGDFKYSYNLAVINKPEYLKPIGVYPVPLKPDIPTAFSMPTIRGIQGLGVAGTFYAMTQAGLEIANSDEPVKEAIYQGSVLGTATWAGMLAGTKAIIPCGKLGALFPMAAPYTVPVCIAGSSILGGILGASATEYTWEAAERYLAEAGNVIKNELSFPSFSLTSRAMASPLLDDYVSPIKLSGQCKSYPLSNYVEDASNHEPADVPKDIAISKSILMSPTEVPPTITDTLTPSDHFAMTEEEAATLIHQLQQDTASLIDIWAQQEAVITGFENCPHIVKQAEQLQNMRAMQAPQQEIKKATSALKDAKIKEYAQRIHFDDHLRTAEGMVNVVGAGIALCGDKKLAKKIITGGGALVTIGKELGALAGFGSAAAAVNPWAAAGNIALSFLSLISLGDEDGATKAILENLEQIKSMIEQFRQEMHDRFNVIDKKLEKIYQDVCDHLAEVKLQNETTQLNIKHLRYENKQMHTHTHEHLKTLQYRIDALFANIHEHAVTQALHAVTDPIRISINYPDLLPSRERYSKWLGQFQLFMEQSSYSALLAGDRSGYLKHLHTEHPFHAHSNSEAEFQVNCLIGYLETAFPEFKKMPSQPNFTVWAYASLAIIRLVDLMNHDKQISIPRNEFNILTLIKDKLNQQRHFREEVNQVHIATKLVDDVQQALRRFSHELTTVFGSLNETKNQHLNESLSLYQKTRWQKDSQDIRGQEFNIRTDYPDWFRSWSKTHYGTNGKGKRAVTEQVTKYKEDREQRVTDLKKIPERPAFKRQAGISLTPKVSGKLVSSIEYDVLDFPHLAIRPKQDNLPIFNLYTPQGYIDLLRQLNVPAVCGRAEYLGIGHLSLTYDLDITTKRISILAELDLKDQTYTVARLDMSFDMGVYDQKEGALWGWYGDTQLNLTQVGPVRYLGSTGDPRHWFKAYGIVPELASPDAGPMKTLAQPGCEQARKFQLADVDACHENIQNIEKIVNEHCQEIYNQYARDAKKLLLTESPLSQSFTALTGALERLEIFMMLALNDRFENTDHCLNYLFSAQDVIPSPGIIKHIFADDKHIGERVLALIEKLELLAQSLEDKKASFAWLLKAPSDKTDCLFEHVCQIIDNAYTYYEHRIHEGGTYQDLFKENEQLKQNFEQVNSLLQILAGAMVSQVQDQETQQRILSVVQAQMQAQGLKLPTQVAAQLQLARPQTPLQKLSFLSSPSLSKNQHENNTNVFRPGNQ